MNDDMENLRLQLKRSNNMNISRGTVATLCLGWAFALLLGVAMGLNVPFILMVVWTVLLLIG